MQHITDTTETGYTATTDQSCSASFHINVIAFG